ncbi:Nn.00g036590.m01.CDS01 [Neocucurbitaria sp. VM-36]
MTSHGWQEAPAGGVQFFMPLTPESFDTPQRSRSRSRVYQNGASRLSAAGCDHDEQYPVLASIKDFVQRLEDTESEIKAEPEEENQILKLNSTSTLAIVANNPLISNTSSSSTPALSSVTNHLPINDIYEQLRSYASSAEDEPLNLNTSSPTEEYDSDQTNFLLTPKTPCPHRGALNTPRQTGSTSCFFQSAHKTRESKNVCRRLDFRIPTTNRVAKRSPRTKTNTKKPPMLEYSGRHDWTTSEQEVLCALFRWYHRNPRAFGKIFNSIFGLNLPFRKTQQRLENYVRLHGEKAFPEYRDVMSVPFDDPEGVYDELRNIIETTAKDLDIEIYKLREEMFYRSGHAATAKSPGVRRQYRSLVRKAILEKKAMAIQIPVTQQPVQRLGGMTLSTTSWEESEFLSEPERNDTSSSLWRPHLVFRVWDESSKTAYIKGKGFLAGAFAPPYEWQKIPPPIPRNDPHHAFKIIAHLHLSKDGDSPLFIATSSSLIQVLVIASKLKNPRIATIELSSDSLQEAHKVSHAAEVFKDLKRFGVKLPYKYRGFGDWFVWADLTEESIVKVEYVSALHDLCNRDPDCAQVLNLDEFDPGLQTMEVASRMREKHTVLNTHTARALGVISRFFAMNGPKVKLNHIVELIDRLVDGFYIQEASSLDIQTMSTLADVFARALGTHPTYNHQQIMCAFIDGIDEGIKSAQRWSRSRSSGKHAKRRKDHFV